MKKYIFSLLITTTLCGINSVLAMEDDLVKKGAVQVRFVNLQNSESVEQYKTGQIKVVSKNDNDFTYQLQSDSFNITPGQNLKVLYDIDVNKGHVMFVILNTARNDFLRRVDLNEGSHQGSLEVTVPENEKTAWLDFIKLNDKGQIIFTIKSIEMKIEEPVAPIVPVSGDPTVTISVPSPTGLSTVVEEEARKLAAALEDAAKLTVALENAQIEAKLAANTAKQQIEDAREQAKLTIASTVHKKTSAATVDSSGNVPQENLARAQSVTQTFKANLDGAIQSKLQEIDQKVAAVDAAVTKEDAEALQVEIVSLHKNILQTIEDKKEEALQAEQMAINLNTSSASAPSGSATVINPGRGTPSAVVNPSSPPKTSGRARGRGRGIVGRGGTTPPKIDKK